MTSIREIARAKVNLTLRVLGRRPDGYHEIESLVAFADAGDRVTLTPRPHCRVRIGGPFARDIVGANLLARTLDVLSALDAGLTLGTVELEKNLPVAAGLGGGSADAAALLRAVRQANPDRADAVAWHEVAARLGAFPDGEARPLPPGSDTYQPSPVVLGVRAALLVAGWLVARQPLIPLRPARLEETLAGHAVALLALALTALVVVATNPFSLVYLLPSLYAWLWLPQVQGASPFARAALLVLGLAGPVLLVVSFATRFDLGLDAPWYLLALVAVGYVPWIVVGIGAVWLAVAAQLTALAAGRYAPYPDVRRRGPRRPLAVLRRHRRRHLEQVDALES